MTYALLLLAWLPWAIHVEARSNGSFVQPPPYTRESYQDNPRYELGRSVNVEWSMYPLGMFDLLLFLKFPSIDGNSTIRAGFTDTINSTKWEVNLDRWKSNLQPGTDVVCYLEVFSRTDYWTFNSTYFNVSIPQNTSKAPEPTPSVSSPGAQGTQTNSPDAGTSAQSPQVSERLSTGAVAGIAVGAGIGGLMFLSGLAFFVWKYCRKRQSFNTPNTTPREPMMTGNNEASSWQKNEPGLSELEARQLHELP